MSAPEPTKIDNLVGQVIDGRYRISRQIAVGGMGVVYEAKHAKIGRSVAVKVLHREMAGDSEVVGRFLNEARAMGTIGHPNIVACTDFGELPGNLPYLVLEYLEGRTLGEEIATTGPMEVSRALRLCVQVASALEAAHSRGVIHRDLTSGNVFLTKTEGDWENAKVLDFGISKFLTATDGSPKTRRGFTMGTPEFMAPEQITHPDVVDARVDIYALGVILYHMLAGKTPFGGPGVAVQTLFLQVVNELPPHIERDDIPAEVLALLDKALAKDPYSRFADMSAMGAALEALAPPPVMSGNYSGRVDAPGSATGSRPVLKLTTMTSRQIGPKSGAYVAATRTSLVEMAAAKVGGGEAPAPRSRRPLVLGALGLVAVVVVAAVLAGRGQKTAAPSAPAAGAAKPGTLETGRPIPTGPVKLEVVSATPSARVTFRGRVHSIPFTDTVDPDSKLEIVEVTAPGREGRRFWLTIDHPMKLSVDLSPGRGIIEATTEEALVALGEREAEPAPAPGAAPVADSAGGKHSHRTAARGKVALASPSSSAAAAAAASSARKAGPASSSASSASEPAPAPAAKAPEPVAATPPPPPAETPLPPPPPAPVAVKPAPAPVKPAPTPAPAAHAAPAAAPSHSAAAAPTIDTSRAQAVFGEHNVDVQRCHQRAKIDNSDIRGKLTLKISISTTGQVSATNIDSSTLHSSALEACIASAVRTWTFPPAVGGTATISHVFVLR